MTLQGHGQVYDHISAAPRPWIDPEYSVECPYGCGTVLTGMHALGNLTRHLRSQACTGPDIIRAKHSCPVEGCARVYIQSDGLREHMRRRHERPPAAPSDEEELYNDDDITEARVG